MFIPNTVFESLALVHVTVHGLLKLLKAIRGRQQTKEEVAKCEPIQEGVEEPDTNW